MTTTVPAASRTSLSIRSVSKQKRASHPRTPFTSSSLGTGASLSHCDTTHPPDFSRSIPEGGTRRVTKTFQPGAAALVVLIATRANEQTDAARVRQCTRFHFSPPLQIDADHLDAIETDFVNIVYHSMYSWRGGCCPEFSCRSQPVMLWTWTQASSWTNTQDCCMFVELVVLGLGQTGSVAKSGEDFQSVCFILV